MNIMTVKRAVSRAVSSELSRMDYAKTEELVIRLIQMMQSYPCGFGQGNAAEMLWYMRLVYIQGYANGRVQEGAGLTYISIGFPKC